MPTSVLTSLGQALRWLRERQGRKQYQVADAAGITKGMLSAYETGRQRPSLETLEKLLDTLVCDLHDLHNALQIVNGQPQTLRQRHDEPAPATGVTARGQLGRKQLYEVLGLSQALPPEEEKAIAQVLDGFHRLLRYLHETAHRSAAPERPEPPPSDDSGDGEDQGGSGPS